jgi:hypothetical protein
LGLVAAACLTLFFLVQYPDIMSPNEKKSYAPAGEASKVTAPANQPLAALPQPRHKKVLAPRRAFTQTESADAYAKEMPAAAGSPVSVNNNYLAMAKPNLSRKKAFRTYNPETDLSQVSPSGGNYAASPPLTLAQSSSNLDYSAGANNKMSELEKKRQEVSASTAAAVPMAAAPQPTTPEPNIAAAPVPMVAASQPAAPEANAVAALPPVSSNDNVISTPTSPAAVLYQSWNGANETTFAEKQVLVTDFETFKSYWESFQPGQALPAVDFTKQAVVVLLDSQRPTSGYLIHVSGLEETTNQLIVHYKTENPPSDSFTAQILTWPWSMQEISKPTKPVVFQRDP